MRRGYQRRSRGPLQVETEGKTLEEAVQAAMRSLHVKREELEYEVMEAARGGFLGLGARPAKIRARVRSGDGSGGRQSGLQVRRSGPSGVGRGTGRGDGRESGRESAPRSHVRQTASEPRVEQRPVKRELRQEDPPDARRSGGERESTDRRPESRRGGRQGQDRRRSSQNRRPGEFREGPAVVPEGRRHAENGDTPRESRPGRTGDAEKRERTRPVTVPTDDAIRTVQDFTKELLDRMGYPSEVKVSWADEAYIVQVSSERGDEVLIGEGGETLDALQHILAKMSSRGQEHLNPVRLNIGGFREKREDELSELALEYGRKVKETGEAVVTEPLRAAERRIIHRTLTDDPDVATHALGSGLMKRVWIGSPGAEAGAETSQAQASESDERSEDPAVAPAPEPVSMIDDRDRPANDAANGESPEWGRRRKPAKGRRR